MGFDIENDNLIRTGKRKTKENGRGEQHLSLRVKYERTASIESSRTNGSIPIKRRSLKDFNLLHVKKVESAPNHFRFLSLSSIVVKVRPPSNKHVE